MDDDDIHRGIAEAYTNLVGAILAHMTLAKVPTAQRLKFLKDISDANEATQSNERLQTLIRSHLALVAPIARIGGAKKK